MAKCQSCSAPLPANTQHCSYCGVRNDVDIHGKHDYRIVERESPRICPECNAILQSIELDIEPPLQIERCGTCYGLFFDPGEVEALLESSVMPVFSVNLELLGNINQDRYRRDKTVKYLKCPVCGTLMNRVVFGHRSGVVIDQCISHGVWLDGGEISHLLEWKKAGGQILDRKKQAERRQKQRRPADSRAEIEVLMERYGKQDNQADLLESVASLIFNVFE
ncbi:zf-TFIIB domain-containing protein [Methylomonas sp. LL1]|uniref:TFIIB-type zinc ribbon-containing protein n=1 Tax=Methylomonas sp. LL1 TaxID=2785785 RepID=UPI0018C42983|nr:zf-TFIIB domain-containing protein [Methylomonas sp. LL1]QPK63813.1 zf-TFIIB domain-containing protein [Methylomonas sp. LL1]